jgi:hypothetical protein
MKKLVKRKTWWTPEDGFTQSLLGTYMECPRRFYNRAILGLSDKDTSIPMRLGTLGHSAIELFRAGKDWKKVLKMPHEKFAGFTVDEMEWMKLVISTIMPYYAEIYAAEKGMIHSERLFDKVKDIADCRMVRLRGKIDGDVTTKKSTVIYETKFKAKIPDAQLDEILSLDLQSLFYLTALSTVKVPTLEHVVGSVVYDVVRYPAFTKKKPFDDVRAEIKAGIEAEPEHWFKRWHTSFTANDLVKFNTDLVHYIQQIRMSMYPRNLKSCMYCKYQRLCATGDKKGLTHKPLFTELTEE